MLRQTESKGQAKAYGVGIAAAAVQHRAGLLMVGVDSRASCRVRGRASCLEPSRVLCSSMSRGWLKGCG